MSKPKKKESPKATDYDALLLALQGGSSLVIQYWDALRTIEKIIGFDIDSETLSSYLATGTFNTVEDARQFEDEYKK